MSALQIHPHSRRVSSLAVMGLALLGAGSFATGMAHKVRPGWGFLPPAPRPAYASPASPVIPDATPAPDMQLAVAEAPVRHHPPKAAEPDTAEAPLAAGGAVADASAVAPDAGQAAPAPEPEPPPASGPRPADPPT